MMHREKLSHDDYHPYSLTTTILSLPLILSSS